MFMLKIILKTANVVRKIHWIQSENFSYFKQKLMHFPGNIYLFIFFYFAS